jgi:hypothetical protein
MNRQIKYSSFLFIIILFSFLITTSCSQPKTEELKPENVCTLTPEQAPEVRGFRLGMTLEQVVNKYPRLCKMPEKTPQFDVNITFYVNQSDKEELLKDCAQYNGLLLNVNNYPELKGVENIDLKIIKNRLSSIKIKYDSSTDENFTKEFTNKIKDSLGLSAWTNWETQNKEESSNTDGTRVSTKTENNQLLCNRVIIKTETSKSHFSNIYPSDNRKRLYDTVYQASLFLYDSDEVAISESQKNHLEEQKRIDRQNAVEQKKAEDKNKTETFKP